MVRRTMVLSTEWAQVEVVDLTNDGNGLGFNLVGGRSTGVVIKYVLPGGIADKDGRLQSGDHVLQVGSVNLRGFTSEQVAAVLRQAGPSVRLLVARPADPATALRAPIPGTALVPTKLLADPELLDRHLIESGYGAVYDLSQCYTEYINGQNGHVESVAAAVSIIGDNPQQIPDQPIVAQAVSPTITITVPVELPPLPEVEIVHVDLNKNVYGLGITVAGYVCEKEELSGIFVKSIIEGSSAEQSGKIKLNDRIIEVDGVSLADKSNPQAVEILRNTGISVHLVLERYLRGPKFEHLQLAIFNEERPSSPSPSTTTLSWFPVPSQAENSITEIEPEPESNTTIDSGVLEVGENEVDEPTQEELDKRLNEILAIDEEEVRQKWQEEIGPGKQIIIAEINKLSGLGISLEGTVDVEGGQEVRPHHYIRSVLPEGPVGQQGTLNAGDELLEANEYRLHGLTHTEVVNILKQLPNRVRLVCARSNTDSGPRPLINLAPDREGFEARKIISGSLNNLTTIVKAQSDTSINTSSTATLTNHSELSKKSRSLECVSGLAMWQSKEDIVELIKGDQGLGFSILDYQDPIDPHGTVIVVRSLVPGGVAEKNGEISPGDRVMSVNGGSIKNATLDQAVQALKGAPRGIVRVGIARPLPSHDATKSKSTTTLNKPS
ncbi:PREDICTED: patj homolog [Papilio xuthus]|uniref:Multiple PDZ domain protein n=1 Tax=Papilio xuthus TaxID=66420 RepID=A0A194PFP2_PAPXU|nr:PREDICTED: patj homolog [Papilio xuthus]KPI92107.1 Multiple PDZ domain protein [Papilio xuthus]